MKINFEAKIFFALIGIIFITIIIHTKIKCDTEKKERDRLRENFRIGDLGDVIKNGIVNGINEAIKDLEKAFKPLIDIFTGIINTISSFINDKIPKTVAVLGYAFEDVGNGIKLQFTNLGIALDTGFTDIFNFMGLFKNVISFLDKFFFEYLDPYLKCATDKISNIGYCIFFYTLDLVGYIIYYVFIELPVYILKLVLGIDLQFIVDLIFSMLKTVNSFFKDMTGYNLLKYLQRQWKNAICVPKIQKCPFLTPRHSRNR
jgi:hypothetical protein